jgi:hypothetical protein
MCFDLKRFKVSIEPRDFYVAGDKVNCLLIIDLVGVLKSKDVLITAIGEISRK